MASYLAVRFGRLNQSFAEDKLVRVLQEHRHSRAEADRSEASLYGMALVEFSRADQFNLRPGKGSNWEFICPPMGADTG